MSIEDADPLPLVRRYLLSSSRVTEALGGEGRVGVENEPPYPCIRLTNPPGDDRDMRHLIAPLIQIEVYGDPDPHSPTPSVTLRRALYAVLNELALLPERQALRQFPGADPADPVVTAVTSTGGGGSVPMPDGQRRYLATVRFHAHAPYPTP